MSKIVKSIFVIASVFVTTIALGQQIQPSNGDNLNYTQILFEVPQVKDATSYMFYISACDFRSENCIAIATVKSKYRSFIRNEDIDFGKNYVWYYTAKKGKKELFRSPNFSFSTQINPLVDTSFQRIEWTKRPKRKRKGIIVADGMKAAFDLFGKPILFIQSPPDHSLRDINLTPNGSITYVDNKLGEIKETKLNGEIIWIGPITNFSLNNSENFHHELEKLSSGNYLAAGKKRVSELEQKSILEKVAGTTLSEAIIEYNPQSEEVWRFDLLPELKRQKNLEPDVSNFNPSRLGHLNGLAMDENRQVVYASFKTFNAIMKINKQTKEILYIYGADTILFTDSMSNAINFVQQHNPSIMRDGNLLVFNNGTSQSGSGIVVLKTGEKLNKSNELIQKISFKDFLQKDYQTNQMGSAQQIDNKNILIGMGTQNHFFEFNSKQKKINYQGYMYQNLSREKKYYNWQPLTSYRVYYYSSLYQNHFIVDNISKKNKQKTILIFNAGTENDTYQIWYQPSNESNAVYIKSIYLKGNKSKRIKAPIDINVIIKSENNKSLTQMN